MKGANMIPDPKTLTLGEGIYYTGDQANIDGWGHIVEVYPPDRWSAHRSYKIVMDDGRVWDGVHPSSFTGPGRRFVTAAEYQAEQEARIEAMQRELQNRKG